MKKNTIIICLILLISYSLSAQRSKSITVAAGTKLIDYFPANERYRYPNFTEGECFLKNGVVISSLFNLNFLSGEMEFIKLSDTLTISNKKDLKLITVAQDTFYYDDGYLEMIHPFPLSVYVKETFEIKNVLKTGAFGTTNRSAASESFGYYLAGRRSYDLIADESMVFQKTRGYFFARWENNFIPFNKKNIIRILPEKKDDIKNHLKAYKVDFKSQEDVLNLADYLSGFFK